MDTTVIRERFKYESSARSSKSMDMAHRQVGGVSRLECGMAILTATMTDTVWLQLPMHQKRERDSDINM